MIKPTGNQDFETISEIINDAAMAYKGVIPDDCWHEPYMPPGELAGQIEDGVIFYGYWLGGALTGVMGMQDKGEVSLIRHAYVRSQARQSGIGSALITYLRRETKRPILIGTWQAASWAIRFYQKHGFRLVDQDRKDQLLRRYWRVSERQIASSVVLEE